MDFLFTPQRLPPQEDGGDIGALTAKFGAGVEKQAVGAGAAEIIEVKPDGDVVLPGQLG